MSTEVSARILAVDDSPTMTRVVRGIFEPEEIEVVTAQAGEEALGVLAEDEGIDLVLLDVLLEGMSGIEVCEKIKSNPETQNTMVIAVTGRPSSGIEKKVTKAGASAFLAKPFKAAQLLELFQETGRRASR